MCVTTLDLVEALIITQANFQKIEERKKKKKNNNLGGGGGDLCFCGGFSCRNLYIYHIFTGENFSKVNVTISQFL